jgi:predicted metal-dependent hydrolase
MSALLLQGPDGQQIPYALERRARRTVGLKITADGLVVHAPRYIDDIELNRLLLSKWSWIVSKISLQSERQLPAVQWQDGEQLLLLGNTLYLDVVEDSANRQAKLAGNSLSLGVKQLDNQAHIARKVLLWYRQYALQDFQRRVALFAAKLKIAPPPVFLSNAKGRWGSCNSRHEIRLNWRLIQAPPALINYVVAHELAHTKQMNHSAKFWAIVEKLDPEYRTAEKALKDWSHRLHRIA